MRVKCLAQEHNTTVPGQAGARTRTARCEVELTNHEATAPPTIKFFLQRSSVQIVLPACKSLGSLQLKNVNETLIKGLLIRYCCTCLCADSLSHNVLICLVSFLICLSVDPDTGQVCADKRLGFCYQSLLGNKANASLVKKTHIELKNDVSVSLD